MAWKGGYWGGYSSHRYGNDQSVKRSIFPAIIKGQKRNDVTECAIDLLRQWRSSPFENEGQTIAGLRSSFCLMGYGWQHAHHEASTIVASAITILGYARPTWVQGQPDYVEARDTCSWCEGAMPDDLAGIHRAKFCSSVCATSAIAHRHTHEGDKLRVVYETARQTIERSKNPKRNCEHCERAFRPIFDNGRFCSHRCATSASKELKPINCQSCGKKFEPRNQHNKFCSKECASNDRVIHADRPCKQCGIHFKPPTGTSFYCSKTCTDEAKRGARVQTECVVCGDEFVARLKGAKFCSTRCTSLHYRIEKREWPKKLNPPIFDYLVKSDVEIRTM